MIRSIRTALLGSLVCGVLACDPPAPTVDSAAKGSASASGSAAKSATAPGTTSAATAPTTAPAKTADPKPADDSVAITKRAAVVGDKETEIREKVTKSSGKLKGKAAPETENIETSEKVEECLAVADNVCTKLKVTFNKHEIKVLEAGKEKEGAPKKTLAGKTFIVEVKDGKVDVSNEDGSKVAASDKFAVAKAYEELPDRAKIMAAIPDKVKVGDSLDELMKVMIAGIVKGDEKAKHEGKITVKAIRDEGGKKVIELELTMKIEGDERGMKMKAEVKGTVDVRADGGVPIKKELTGPFEIEMDGDSLTGTTTDKSTSTYSW